MKTIIRLAWLAPVLALALELRAVAQAPVVKGKILILANDGVLQGDIERAGDEYRIRRGASETLVAAGRAKRLCADWDEALMYLRAQANLDDADERLRLARWCQQHGLKDQALIEAKAALELRPAHPETKQLLHVLQRTATAPTVAPIHAPVVRPPERLPQLDLSADSLTLFTTKVQPILMNTCASCHTQGQGGNFHLLRVSDGGSRPTTQHNLAAAVAQLRLDHPAASPLLVKAVSAHGAAAQPPLRDRRVVPFQMLLHWAEQVAANNPHLRDPRVAVASAQRSSPETAVAFPPAPTNNLPTPSPVVSRPAATANPMAANIAVTGTFANPQQAIIAGQAPPSFKSGLRTAARPVENPNDVVDPEGFNQLGKSRQ